MGQRPLAALSLQARDPPRPRLPDDAGRRLLAVNRTAAHVANRFHGETKQSVSRFETNLSAFRYAASTRRSKTRNTARGQCCSNTSVRSTHAIWNGTIPLGVPSPRLSPVEAVEAQLAYAGEVSDKVNAISQISPTAIDEARESERRWAAGCPIGPLDGVPVVVKDSYHIAGMKRWHGSAIHNGDAPSTGTSEPIARLREAGAIVVAKTTMPDMGMLGSGISSQFGIVRNPWDTTVSPGGSSAGVGASLACGLGAFGLGTDIAGSVRLPAAHCGLAAIKPTQGRIAYSPASTMRSSGVMGRSVSDVVEGLLRSGKAGTHRPDVPAGGVSRHRVRGGAAAPAARRPAARRRVRHSHRPRRRSCHAGSRGAP